MHQCRVPGKPYSLPATLLGHSEAVGYQMVVSLVGPRDPPDREARTSLVSDVDLLGSLRMLVKSVSMAKTHKQVTRTAGPSRAVVSREHITWLVERLVFLDHPDDLTGPYAIRLDRRGPNVSRLYPSGAVQVDVEHPGS